MFEEWSDQQLISNALNMWANYVETGNVAMSAKSAKEMNEEVYTLNHRQKELVDRMRKLATEALKGDDGWGTVNVDAAMQEDSQI